MSNATAEVIVVAIEEQEAMDAMDASEFPTVETDVEIQFREVFLGDRRIGIVGYGDQPHRNTLNSFDNAFDASVYLLGLMTLDEVKRLRVLANEVNHAKLRALSALQDATREDGRVKDDDSIEFILGGEG
jgi:hypothetical protein